MARSQQVSGSRRTLAYAVFIGMTFGLAVSVVTMTRRAERLGEPLRNTFSLQVSYLSKNSCIPYFQHVSAKSQVKLACRGLQPCTECLCREAQKRTLRDYRCELAKPLQLHALS